MENLEENQCHTAGNLKCFLLLRRYENRKIVKTKMDDGKIFYSGKFYGKIVYM